MSNILKGRILEELTSQCLNNLNKKFKKNPINGLGPDHIVNEEKVVIEEKNWNPEHIISPTRAKREIISRFKEFKMKKRLLIISKLNAGEETKKLLQESGIDVIELGYQITNLKSYRLFRRSKKILFKKLKSYFVHLTRLKKRIDALSQSLSIQSALLNRYITRYYPCRESISESNFALLPKYLRFVSLKMIKYVRILCQRSKIARKMFDFLSTSLIPQKLLRNFCRNITH